MMILSILRRFYSDIESERIILGEPYHHIQPVPQLLTTIRYINNLLVGVSRASWCLLSTSLTVDGFTVTRCHERTERDLTATIAVAIRLLGSTKETLVEARGGSPQFASLTVEKREEDRGEGEERDCFILVAEISGEIK